MAQQQIQKGTKKISELEKKLIEVIQFERQKEEGMKENEQSLRDLWDTTKCVNIHIKGAPKGKKKE